MIRSSGLDLPGMAPKHVFLTRERVENDVIVLDGRRHAMDAAMWWYGGRSSWWQSERETQICRQPHNTKRPRSARMRHACEYMQ